MTITVRTALFYITIVTYIGIIVCTIIGIAAINQLKARYGLTGDATHEIYNVLQAIAAMPAIVMTVGLGGLAFVAELVRLWQERNMIQPRGQR